MRNFNRVYSNSLVFILTSVILCHGQELGEPCVNRLTQAKGFCALIQNCDSARNLLATGKRPTRCGFHGKMPIVCCEETRKPGDISNKKCREYGEFVYETKGQSKASTCGATTISLIVGGTKAKPREFPHQTAIGYGSPDAVASEKWKCGGSLISENFVLTAAHCAITSVGSPKYIRLGDINLDRTDDDSSPEDYNVAEVTVHPEYKPPSMYHDIALLRLDRSVKFNKYIRPACLQTSLDNGGPNETKFIATGWGKTDYIGDVSSDLLKVTLDLFPHPECKDIYRTTSERKIKNGIIEEMQLCAGSRTENKDTCQGDSGGPLQILNHPKEVYCTYKIVGVTSFGKVCGSPGVPGVYTRVSHYIDWIEKIVWK